MSSGNEGQSTVLYKLIYVIVILAIAGLWAAVILLTQAERDFNLERARSQLETTVITLADFNELAEQAGAGSPDTVNDSRTDAIWRALLQYPQASIWVESDGEVLGGMPAESDADAITVEESRSGFTVYASLPQAAPLAEWQETLFKRFVILAVISLAFLVLTWFLVFSLKQRARVERAAAMMQERNEQLTRYRAELEETVAQRTTELKTANDNLESELEERRRTEKTLREHDAMLSAVAKSAGQLLSTHQHGEAINAVLELIGQTISVSRVQLVEFRPDHQGHTRGHFTNEWHAPGQDTMLDSLQFQDFDISEHYPKTATQILSGNTVEFSANDIPNPQRPAYREAGMRNFLMIPVEVEDRAWGSLVFIDSDSEKRNWSWAETDTLKTLAGLIGVSMTRARYVQELADANTIVQNSPTILYRLKGIPSFPLIYISHNITKFNHSPDSLTDSTQWIETLVMPEDQEKVQSAMERLMEPSVEGASIEFRLRTDASSFRWVENRYTPVRDNEGRLIEIEGIIIDITERKAAEEKIATLARTDGLTGLANRATFTERLRQAFSASQRGAKPFAVLFMDLDHFKTINDTMGHPAGDQLLKDVSARLLECTRETDLVARLGGDEFAILQTEINEPENAGTLAQSLLKSITRPYKLGDNEVYVTTSIGICPYYAGSADSDSMLSQAGLALYRAKEEGRNQYRFHSSDLDEQVMERSAMGEELRQALERGEFFLAYQPQVSMADGSVVGLEALARWNHPIRGILTASEFIGTAEKTGNIMGISHWVLNEACRQLQEWREQNLEVAKLTLNLSILQLKNSKEFIREVCDAVEKWELKPQDLEFDVTEAMLAQATWSQNDALFQLRKLGFSIAIDNFGTEYSSFDYLRSYSVNHLKIGQAFINRALKSEDSAAAIRAIIQLASDLGIGVIAEGIENEEQRDFLLSIGNTANAQGYYYAGAETGESLRMILRNGHVQLHRKAEKELGS